MKNLILKAFYSLAIFTFAFSSSALLAQNQQVKGMISSQFDQTEQQVDQLLQTIDQRLSLIPEIAKWNWNHTQPILDLKSEEAFINEAAEKAKNKGVNPTIVKEFFAGQIEAAKLIQIEAFEAWVDQRAGKFDQPADVLKIIKPKIKELDEKLITQLSEIAPLLGKTEFKELLQKRAPMILKSYSSEVQQASIEGLVN